MPHDRHPLKHLAPGWYATVMGLTGLALAWHRAEPLMGPMAQGVALVIGGLAALVFAVLAVATVLRAQRHPEAWAEDRRHPVRHTFIATLPIAAILLGTVAVALFGPNMPARLLWGAGAIGQLWVTLWVLGRWWKPGGAPGGKPAPGGGAGGGGLAWPGVTPALLIPIVGNVLVPLAGVPLGHTEWAAAQFGIGLLFWPVVLVLIAVRIGLQGLWPERLLPVSFILIAPPAVVGLSALQLGAPPLVAWLCWGMALFTLGWVAQLLPRIRNLPFGVSHWGMSFPMAALAALTLRLATPGGLLAVLGPVLLAATSLLILVLVLSTLRGLRDGTLLQPEPVAMIAPAQP